MAGEKNEQFKKRLYKFTLDLIREVEQLPKDQVTRVITDQLIRSVTSICANYIEAYAASSRRDFTNYFNHSLKSANESKFWVALLRDSSKMQEKKADEFLAELDQISKILGSSILTLRGKR